MKYEDFRKDKIIGTSNRSNIKCSSFSTMEKVVNAHIYPVPGTEVLYYNEYYDGFVIGTVEKYKTPLTIVISGKILTLRKDGNWYYKRDKGLYNVFDIKYLMPCIKEF